MKIYKVKVNGKVYEVELESVTESTAPISAPKTEVKETPVQKPSEGYKVVAPMQGSIIKSNIQVGSKVAKGSVLVVLEAMKLENDILSPIDGVIKQLHVAVGQKVDANQLLVIVG